MNKNDIIGKIDIFNKNENVTSTINKQLLSFRQSISKRLKCKFYDLKDEFYTNDRIIRMLICSYNNVFYLWWNNSINIYDFSYILCQYCNTYFDYWWDPDQFDWRKIKSLILHCPNTFVKWWHPEKYKHCDQLSLYSYLLYYKSIWQSYCNEEDINILNYPLNFILENEDLFLKYLESQTINKRRLYNFSNNFSQKGKKYFNYWFDKNIYDYKNITDYFIRTYKDYFYYWFDKEIFDELNLWENVSWSFAKHLSHLFDDWFDPNTFVYSKNYIRMEHRLDKRKIKIARHELMKNCSDHIYKWYDKKRIRSTKENFKFLKNYCLDSKELWGADYLVMKLGE